MARAKVSPVAGYEDLFAAVVGRVRHTQASLVARSNAAMIELYWQIGREILARQDEGGYGAAVIDRLASDLAGMFPGQRGWSPRNLRYMRAFANAWPEWETVQNLLQHLGWGQNQLLLDRLEDRTTREWYARRAVGDGWTHTIMLHQLMGTLHLREGAAPSNFPTTVPDLAGEQLDRLATDPYRLDFLRLDSTAKEHALEAALVERITEFLTHLGRGFAYCGRQYRLTVGESDFFLDLLFYNTHLHAYVVFELKTQPFTPAHAGQISFYITAIERQVRRNGDNPTIGILLVPGKDDLVVEYTLASTTSPLAVASYTHSELPANVRAQLPAAADIAAILSADTDLATISPRAARPKRSAKPS